MERAVEDSQTENNSIEDQSFNKREALKACSRRILETTKREELALEDIVMFEKSVLDCLYQSECGLTVTVVEIISELLLKRHEALSHDLRLLIVEALCKKLMDAACFKDSNEPKEWQSEDEKMILECLQLLNFMTTISSGTSSKITECLSVEAFLELAIKTSSYQIKILVTKLATVVCKSAKRSILEYSEKLIGCLCNALGSDTKLNEKHSTVEVIRLLEVPLLEETNPSVQSLWKDILKALVSTLNKLQTTSIEEGSDVAIKEWELFALVLDQLAAFVKSDVLLGYACISNGFLLQLESWLRIQDTSSINLFGSDNCRLHSFMKHLQTFLEEDEIKVLNNGDLEELSSVFDTSDTVHMKYKHSLTF